MHVDHSRPLFTVITTMGRPEYDYLLKAGRSLLPLNGYASHEGAGVEWLIVIDPNGLATEEKIKEALFGLRISRTILVNDSGRTGPGPARNVALAAATGAWIITLDADDELNPDGATALYAAAQQAGVDWAAGKTYNIDPGSKLLGGSTPDPFPTGRLPRRAFWDYRLAHGDWPFHCCAVIARTEAIRAVGGWADLRRNEDTAMIAVLGAQYDGVYEPVYVHFYRQHPNSITADKAEWNATDEAMGQLAAWVAAGRVGYGR